MDRFKRLTLPMALSVTVALSGCLSSPVSRTEYAKFTEAPLTDAEFMPTEEEMNPGPIRVVVLDGEDGNSDLAATADLGGVLSKTVAGKISEKRVEVIDSKLAPRLSDALRLAESKGSSTYSGPKVANFAIKATVTAATVTASANSVAQLASVASSLQQIRSSANDAKGAVDTTKDLNRIRNMPEKTAVQRFQKNQALTNFYAKQNKASTNQAPSKEQPVSQPTSSMDHRAQVNATVHVYSMPDLRLLDSVSLQGSKTLTTPSANLDDAAKVSLLRSATVRAVEQNQPALFNAFTRRGFIAAKKSDGKKSIFLVSIGKGAGLRPGEKVSVFSRRKAVEGFKKTDSERLEEVMVAEGIVMDNLTENDAWIDVADADMAKRIMRGDAVKSEHRMRSIFGGDLLNIFI